MEEKVQFLGRLKVKGWNEFFCVLKYINLVAISVAMVTFAS